MRLIFIYFICCINNLYFINSYEFSENCGKSYALSFESAWRIEGGTKTVPGEFPWQVILTREYIDEEGIRWQELCGGTIINERWILTAAHCVAEGKSLNEFTVQLGVQNMTKKDGVFAKLDKILYHTNYTKEKINNDIALLKLASAIDFANKNKQLAPICLATPTTPSLTNCYATGFGQKSASLPASDVLLKVLEPVVDNSHCTKIHELFRNQTNLCAGGSSLGGTGVCMGDSGGPLQCQSSDSKWYQIGITSYGIPCAVAGDPDVFTKVSAYIDWIKSVIQIN